MGRLVDADDFIEQLGSSDREIYFKGLIEEQPTAFDVEAVVKELEALTEKHMAISEKAAELGKVYENHTILNGDKGMAYEHAIEIVRKGGAK